MLLNVSHDSVGQLTYTFERTTTNLLVGDVAKPPLNKIQPRTARRDEVHVEPRMPLQPCFDPGMFVRVVVIHDQVQVHGRRRLFVHKLEKLDPLLMAMTRHARSNQLTLRQFQRCKQRRGPIALVIMRHRTAPALLERKARLRAIQGLNLALLVAAQNERMVRRIEIQPDNIHQFVDEVGVAAEFESSDMGRFQIMRLPYAIDQIGTDTQMFGQRPNAPVRCVGRRLMKSRLDDSFSPALLLGWPAAATRSIFLYPG